MLTDVVVPAMSGIELAHQSELSADEIQSASISRSVANSSSAAAMLGSVAALARRRQSASGFVQLLEVGLQSAAGKVIVDGSVAFFLELVPHLIEARALRRELKGALYDARTHYSFSPKRTSATSVDAGVFTLSGRKHCSLLLTAKARQTEYINVRFPPKQDAVPGQVAAAILDVQRPRGQPSTRNCGTTLAGRNGPSVNALRWSTWLQTECDLQGEYRRGRR